MHNERLERIQKNSRKLGLLFSALLVLIPLANGAFWLLFNSLPTGFISELPVTVQQDLSPLTLGLAFLISLVPLSVVLFGVQSLRKLFALYERAVFFSSDNVHCFRDLGYALMVWVAASTLYTTVLSVILTLPNPPGQRQVVLQFGSGDLGILIAGAIVIVIARIMNEARLIEDENAYTI